MTSKEALKELKENAQEVCEWELDRLNIIEKDLEVLEILKKYSYLVKRYRDSIDKDTIRTSLYCMNIDELEKVKEWLEK